MADVPEAVVTENPGPCSALIPMEEWVKGDGGGACRPCLLAPVTQWYGEILSQHGLPDLAHSLEELASKVELAPSELAKQLDSIKSKVSEPVRQRLLEFDCSAQAYEGNNEANIGESEKEVEHG